VKLPYLADNQLTALCKRLQGQGYGALKDLLREQGKTPFDEGSVIPTLDSSYKENGYQYLFYALTRLLQPERIVEIGVLQGFSLLSMGCALKANGRGEFHAFDLFEEYEFKCDNFDNVSSRVSTMGLDKMVTLHQADASSVTGLIEETDMLHVDISNNGDIIGEIFSQWASRTSRIMIFEGGSLERDRVEWMVKYRKRSLYDKFMELDKNEAGWDFFTISPFPSVTIAVNVKYES